MARSDTVSLSDLKADLETAFGAAYRVNPSVVLRIRGKTMVKRTVGDGGPVTESLLQNPIVRFCDTTEEAAKVADFVANWFRNNGTKMDKADPLGYDLEKFPLDTANVMHFGVAAKAANAGLDLSPLVAKFKALSPEDRKLKAAELLAAGVSAETVNGLILAATLG